MDQTLALNALTPFLALAKSATSPRAAADLITQATSAPNTYLFAELIVQPNVQALKGHEQYGTFYDMLGIFAWGTWESYKATPNLPQLSDGQSLKLRLLSMLTIAAEKTTSATESNLSYISLCTRLDLASTIDLEHLVTQAIYSNLLTATLNPASQTVVITSVSPLRDLAPGSVASMINELETWSTRCTTVLADLDAEINKVRALAQQRHARALKTEKQVKAAMESTNEKVLAPRGAGGHNSRGAMQKEQDEDDEMEVDGGMGSSGAAGRQRGSGGIGGFMGRIGSGRRGGR